MLRVQISMPPSSCSRNRSCSLCWISSSSSLPSHTRSKVTHTCVPLQPPFPPGEFSSPFSIEENGEWDEVPPWGKGGGSHGMRERLKNALGHMSSDFPGHCVWLPLRPHSQDCGERYRVHGSVAKVLRLLFAPALHLHHLHTGLFMWEFRLRFSYLRV